ncbi:MAG: hypothetical protein RIR33_3456 [Pseudomonadota bacterium]|jgi:hypothetical protein
MRVTGAPHAAQTLPVVQFSESALETIFAS